MREEKSDRVDVGGGKGEVMEHVSENNESFFFGDLDMAEQCASHYNSLNVQILESSYPGCLVRCLEVVR